MQLSEILNENRICLDIQGETKEEVIRELATLAANDGNVSDLNKLIEALMMREKIQTTGIGYGMAIPHATAEGVRGVSLVLGLSKKGIDFGSLDGRPVRLIFLLAGEPRLQTSFLSILSKISRFFRKEDFRQEVLKANSAQEIISMIRAREEQ